MALVDSLAAEADITANSARSSRGEDRGPAQRPALSVAPAASSPKDSGVRRNEGKHTVWRIQCGDLISRERCVTVFVDNDEVVLVGPPGETARMTGGQLGQLRAALNEAAKLAER
ncbi:hypothetical protein CFN78_12935 [Amycolatopsis antarctica]|uniref:Uncharacterized protein n=1 Tax=Amycolatopsis antarctica TaxID=1854586 RepID=A0A263D263_9PSEU|nr:hypothetical protein [Amycolatopsis antarctica]OZM72550.1 hypothetical protein CFN78_12935 [Amycolatopsis antarctica]